MWEDIKPLFHGLFLLAHSETYDKLHIERLLSHCIASYYDVYERSSLNGRKVGEVSYLTRMKDKRPDATVLVLAEYAYL